MASTEINQDMHSVCRVVEQAEGAVQHEQWDAAERALIEVQDRIGRLLREIGLRRSGVRYATITNQERLATAALHWRASTRI